MKMNKGKTLTGKLDTYIGEGSSFEGRLSSKDNLSIYGNVSGSIECQGRIVIGESGNVEADIIANEVVVSGKVVGNVTAKTRLEMTSSGAIQGDIKTARLIMEDGGKFDGHSEMLSDGKSPAMRSRKAEPPALESANKSSLPSASRN